MKVLSVFGVEPLRIGGTEAFARELSEQLRDRGWDSVLCFESQAPEDVRRFLQSGNVSLEVLANPTEISWQSALNLWRIIQRHRPEILHLHYTGFLGIYPWLGRLAFVRKVFFTDHTSRPEGYVASPAPVWKKVLVRVINWPLDKVTCVSNYGRDCMVTLGVLPRNRYEVIYNSVDLPRVQPDVAHGQAFRRRYSIPDDRKLVLQVSWMIPEKGVSDLLKAAEIVVRRDPTVHFALVGEGELREHYEQEAAAMGLREHVTWTGLIKNPFEEGVYDAADILCQMSRWEEAFGWVIAEAMAFGKP